MKRHQKHVKGEDLRVLTWACVHPDTKADIESLALEQNISESWVVNFALEEFLYGKAFTPFPNAPKHNRKTK